MPFGSIKQAKDKNFPTSMGGVPLTLSQVNKLADIYDGVNVGGSADEPMAVAVAQFQNLFTKTADGWRLKEAVYDPAVKWDGPVVLEGARWSEDYTKALPDAAFLGEARQFPYRNANGDIDLAHLREAISLMPAGEPREAACKILTDEVMEAIMSEREITFYEGSAQVLAGEWLEIGECKITEGKDGGPPILHLTIIQEGFSKNVHTRTRRKAYKRFYPADTLEEAAAHAPAKGWPVYLGERGHEEKPGVSKRVGTTQGVLYEGGKIRATLPVYEDMRWIVDRLKQDPTMVGPSIEAGGRVRLGRVGGTEAAVVEALDINRILLVENPAARGTIDGIREGEEEDEGGDTVELTLTQLKEDFPEVHRAALVEAEATSKTAEDVKAKDATIAELTEAKEKLEAENKEFEATVAEAEAKELVEAALPGKMPEVSKGKLRKALKGETDKTKIEEAVKAEAEYNTALTGAGKPKGMAAPDGKKGSSFEEAVKAAEEMGGLGDDEDED